MLNRQGSTLPSSGVAYVVLAFLRASTDHTFSLIPGPEKLLTVIDRPTKSLLHVQDVPDDLDVELRMSMLWKSVLMILSERKREGRMMSTSFILVLRAEVSPQISYGVGEIRSVKTTILGRQLHTTGQRPLTSNVGRSLFR